MARTWFTPCSRPSNVVRAPQPRPAHSLRHAVDRRTQIAPCSRALQTLPSRGSRPAACHRTCLVASGQCLPRAPQPAVARSLRPTADHRTVQSCMHLAPHSSISHAVRAPWPPFHTLLAPRSHVSHAPRAPQPISLMRLTPRSRVSHTTCALSPTSHRRLAVSFSHAPRAPQPRLSRGSRKATTRPAPSSHAARVQHAIHTRGT